MSGTNEKEPMFEIAQLASVEIFSPKVDDTVKHFTSILGMEIAGRDAHSVKLRGYEDSYAYSLKVTDQNRAGSGVITFRTHSRQALERRAKALEASGLGEGWAESDISHGPAYQFRTPDGHRMQLVWDIVYADIPQSERSLLLNRPSKRPTRGVPVRRLDHVNLMASDVPPMKRMLMDLLCLRLSEHVVMNDGSEIAVWLRATSLVHDIAIVKDATGSRGRLHHVAFWYGYPQHLMDVADLLTEAGLTIEAGPSKHGVSQAYHLYYFEPGGNRIELFGDSGYLIFDPTHKPVKWTEDRIRHALIWIGAPLPPEFFVYGTPIVESNQQTLSAAAE